jgi:hypothetical protein
MPRAKRTHDAKEYYQHYKQPSIRLHSEVSITGIPPTRYLGMKGTEYQVMLPPRRRPPFTWWASRYSGEVENFLDNFLLAQL